MGKLRTTIKEQDGFSIVEVKINNSYHWEIRKNGIKIAALGKRKWAYEYLDLYSNGCPSCGGELLPEEELVRAALCCKDCDLIFNCDLTEYFDEEDLDN